MRELASPISKELVASFDLISGGASEKTDPAHTFGRVRQHIDALKDERQDLNIRLSDFEKVDRPKMLSVNRTDLED